MGRPWERGRPRRGASVGLPRARVSCLLTAYHLDTTGLHGPTQEINPAGVDNNAPLFDQHPQLILPGGVQTPAGTVLAGVWRGAGGTPRRTARRGGGAGGASDGSFWMGPTGGSYRFRLRRCSTEAPARLDVATVEGADLSYRLSIWLDGQWLNRTTRKPEDIHICVKVPPDDVKHEATEGVIERSEIAIWTKLADGNPPGNDKDFIANRSIADKNCQ